MSSSSPYIDISHLRLLGTAHVATTSVEAVKEQRILSTKDRWVELCKTRQHLLRRRQRRFTQSHQRRQGSNVLMQAMLSAEQRLGLNEGQDPEQKLSYVETAKQQALKLVVIGHQVTMRRAWKKMKWREFFDCSSHFWR